MVLSYRFYLKTANSETVAPAVSLTYDPAIVRDTYRAEIGVTTKLVVFPTLFTIS